MASSLVIVYHRQPYEEHVVDGKTVFRENASPNGIVPALKGFIGQTERASWVAWKKAAAGKPPKFQRRITGEKMLEGMTRYFQAGAGNLHDGFHRAAVHAAHDEGVDHPLDADRSDFHRTPVAQHLDQRDQPMVHEEDRACPVASVCQALTRRKTDGAKLGAQLVERRRRQCPDYPVTGREGLVTRSHREETLLRPLRKILALETDVVPAAPPGVPT